MNKKNIVFIPGGPGLCSKSFERLDALSESFNLHYFNPMGTKSELTIEPTYQNLLSELKDYLKDLNDIILVGHSFGGIQAIDLTASQSDLGIIGLAVIGAPVSSKAFTSLSNRFSNSSNKEMDKITDELSQSPSDQKYKEWFEIQKSRYFSKEKLDDIKCILDGDVCVQSYTLAMDEATKKVNQLRALAGIDIKKVYISGDSDFVTPLEIARHEAHLGGFIYRSIENASHFAHYEQPTQFMNILTHYFKENNNEELL